MVADAVIHHNGNDRRIVGVGNGRLDAVSNAINIILMWIISWHFMKSIP